MGSQVSLANNALSKAGCDTEAQLNLDKLTEKQEHAQRKAHLCLKQCCKRRHVLNSP